MNYYHYAEMIFKYGLTSNKTKITPEPLLTTKVKQQHFEKHQKMNDKMMQLFKQFGITQFDFKGHDRVDVLYGKTGNEYFF
jgi:hypothetical protein